MRRRAAPFLAVAAAVLLLLAAASPVVVVLFAFADPAMPDLGGSAGWTGDQVAGSPGWWAVLAFAAAAGARFTPRIAPFRRWIDCVALLLLVGAVAWGFGGGHLATSLQLGDDLPGSGQATPSVTVRPAFGCVFALLAPIALVLARWREAVLPPPPPAPPLAVPPGSVAAAVIGAAVGLLPIYPAVVLAIISAGLGHGHYVAARALFPIPMLLTRATCGEIGLVVMALVLLQFPAYGATLGWGLAARRWRPVAIVAAAHGLATLLDFAGLLIDFG